jgi:hypothetical protein
LLFGYYFEIGSAELSDAFEVALTDKVVPRILEIAAQYPDVNIIEVVGHTDEQHIRRRYSNLDEVLLGSLKSGDVSSLVPADNAGLGLARAVAVVTRLLNDNRLQRFTRILPLSGAQLKCSGSSTPRRVTLRLCSAQSWKKRTHSAVLLTVACNVRW